MLLKIKLTNSTFFLISQFYYLHKWLISDSQKQMIIYLCKS